jgi:hypothetical protein
VHTGVASLIEADPTCIVHHPSEDAMRGALKQLSIGCTVEPAEVVAGSAGLLTVTMTNSSSGETTLILEGRTRPAGARTDWARVAGVPEPHSSTPDAIRLFFPMTTTDASDHDVDALPTIAGSTASPAAPTTFAVHLRPSGKLTHSVSWWALRIPAPQPVVQDDAGHRYVPKTSAIPLSPGDYNISVELPFYGLSREERKVSTRVHVTRAPLLDGGKQPSLR